MSHFLGRHIFLLPLDFLDNPKMFCEKGYENTGVVLKSSHN